MKAKLVVIFVTLCAHIISISYFQYVGASQAPDLYSSADDVIRLNSTTFIPSVFHQNKNMTYMVEFYNTFCGHCQLFAPIYKELATRTKNWTSVIKVAGLDCSKDENVNTCSENKIDGYPTIYIYPPNARIQDPNDAPLNLRSLNIDWTVDDIEETLIDYVANLSTSKREHSLVSEALQPITVNDKKDLQQLYTPQNDLDLGHHSAQDLMILVESGSTYLGRKLIVDYYRIHNKLELRRVLLSNKSFLKSILPESEFNKLDDIEPLLVHLEKDTVHILVRGEAKHVLPTSDQHEREDFIYNRFKTFLEHYYSVELKEKFGEIEPNLNARKIKPPFSADNEISHKQNGELDIQYLLESELINGKRLFAIDLLKGITYMLTHEVRIKGDLNPVEYNIVRNLLTIIKKYLPLQSWDSSVYKFIVDLRTRLDDNRNKYEKDGITSQEMSDLLQLSGAEAVKLRYNRENWASCLKSDKHNKGYTCSLWLLFHSLTVGEYLKAAPVRTRPTLVLFTMRDYITKFFGCTVCSSNFAKETESLENNLNNRNSSVLWLWYTHNLVNQRLNNERTNDKRQLAEIIFPSTYHCPKCITTSLDEVGNDGKTLEDIDWNQSNVLQFMTELYKPEKIISPKEMASLLSRVKGKVNYDLIDMSTSGIFVGSNGFLDAGADMNQSEKWNIHSIFSTSDISLCLFLYLACIMIVALVCVSLNPKWKRFKTK